MQTATLIWFGNEVLIQQDGDHATIQLDQGDPVDAVCSALDALEKKPKQVRLIYQPNDLDTQPVEIPKAGRAALGKILENNGHTLSEAWGCLTLFPQGRTYSTLLIIEAQPRLPRLRQALEEIKIQLIGVWPLAAVLDTLPPFNKSGAPGIALVQSSTAALIYSVDNNSTRSVHMASGMSFREDAITAASQKIAAHDPAKMPPILLARFDEQETFSQAIGQVVPVQVAAEDLIAAVGKLPTGGLANMLPKEFRFNYNACMVGFGVSTIALAVLLAFLYWVDLQHVAKDTAKKHAQIAQYQERISRLTKNRETIEANNSFAAEASPNPPAVSELLATVGRVLGDNAPVSLRSLRVTDSMFAIDGTIYSGVGTTQSPYHKFYDALAAAGAWKFNDGTRQNTATADFTITGTFIAPTK